MSIEYQVLIRFGQWDALLSLPTPHKDLPFTTAMWRFARATALAAKKEIAAAQQEQVLFHQACAAVPEEAMGAVNRARDVPESIAVAQRFKAAWSRADTQIDTTCFCARE